MLRTTNDQIKQDRFGIIIWDRIEIVYIVEKIVETHFSGLDKNTDKGHWPEG